MPSENPRIFRVFVASPGDVTWEREIVFDVIKDYNETWGKSSNPQVQLEVHAWEYSVPSSAGNPQEVINQWIHVEGSDIFIALLWKRFGTPPEIIRPQDDKPYLSGTQFEIESAYESWKTRGKPHFMLYWKEDDLSMNMSSDDIEQFRLVKDYMRKFETGGEYPTLIKRFKKGKFKQLIKRELAQVINNLLKTQESDIAEEIEVPIPPPITTDNNQDEKTEATKPSESAMADPIETWLKRVKLRANPFLYQDAEDDDSIPAYFTRFHNLSAVTTSDLTFERKSWFFFGREGNGKTALRKFIAARGRPKKTDSDMVCIEYDRVKFGHLLNNTGDISEFQYSFVQSIFEAVSIYTGNAISSSAPPDSLRGNLINLSVELRKFGINWVLCLIDPGRATFEWKGSQVSTAKLIAPLFSLSEVGGYGFRYFLPDTMRDELEPTFSNYPFNYIRVKDIWWDERTLRDMLGKRMTQLSVDQLAPYRSLGELCEDEQNLSTLIDVEIASFAQGNPRAAIWLANSLIERHCEGYPTPPRITPETWNNVKWAWWLEKESQILGTARSSGFRILSDRIYYQNKEIILPERSDHLLKALIISESGFCPKRKLVEAGWVGEKNLDVISAKTLSEALRRMKEEVKRELKDKGYKPFDCIKSVRGRGYRLVQPSVIQNVQEGRDDR